MLIEALIAVLIFSVGVIAVVGLQAVATRELSESRFRSDASYLADSVIGEITAGNNNNPGARDGTYSATSNPADLWSLAITDPNSGLPNGQMVVATAGNQVTVTVSWQARGAVSNFTQIGMVVD
jgi:type IV pilus assembly protein PilV